MRAVALVIAVGAMGVAGAVLASVGSVSHLVAGTADEARGSAHADALVPPHSQPLQSSQAQQAPQVLRALQPLQALRPLESPAPANSAQPQLSTQGDRTILSWIEREGARAALRFAERVDEGWSEPRTVASGDDFFVNWADVPSVRALADGSLAAHWLQKSSTGTYAYDVRLSFSKDDGRTWSTPVSPHHDGTKTEHGFASLFQAPGAGLGLVWLDGRAMKAGGGHGEGHGENGGAMTVRAATFDSSGQQRSELLVDDRVCECCPTATAVTSEGAIAAFRNRTEKEIRDIYVSRFVEGKWTTPAAVHDDNWHMTACPVNGPALSARGRQVAIAWFTVQRDEGRTFVAFSDNAGRTFGAPIRVDDVMSLGRVDVELLSDGSAAISWIEFADQRAEVRVRHVDRRGTRAPAVAVSAIDAGRTSGYPRLTLHGNELLFAWTATGGTAPRVMTARAGLNIGAKAAR